MNPKNILLLSGASLTLLAPSAIANPEEAIPAPVIESDLQAPEPVVVEVQVAQPEVMVEAIAPVIPAPTISPPEPFAPDFSVAPAPVPEAIAPTAPNPIEPEIESVPVADRTDEIVSSPSEVRSERDEKSDKSVTAATEATPTPLENSSESLESESLESIEAIEETESTEDLEDLNELAENPEFEAIAPITEFPNQQSENLPVEPLNEFSNQSDLSHQSDNELDRESLDGSSNQSEREWTENSPRLYGVPEVEADLIERLAQDDLDHWTPEEWVDLLLSEDDPAENAANGNDSSNGSSTNLTVSKLKQEAELSQTQFETVQPDRPRNITLNSDPDLPKPDAPQTLDPASAALASADTNSADTNLDTSFDNASETAPRYRLVVGDRLVFNVSPYRFDWKPTPDPDSIRKQKLRGRSLEVSPDSQAVISAGMGFDLQISNRAQFQFAYGAQDANGLVSKAKISSAQPSIEMPSLMRDIKAAQIKANQLVKTESLTETLKKADLVERIAPIEGSHSIKGITSPDTSTHQFVSPVREVQPVTLKTEKTNLTGEFSKPAFNFNRSFEWRITPTVVLNTWGGLTVNPLPPDSPILSLTYLFYLGFPDPLDRGSDRLVFLVGQPPRLTQVRR